MMASKTLSIITRISGKKIKYIYIYITTIQSVKLQNKTKKYFRLQKVYSLKILCFQFHDTIIVNYKGTVVLAMMDVKLPLVVVWVEDSAITTVVVVQ